MAAAISINAIAINVRRTKNKIKIQLKYNLMKAGTDKVFIVRVPTINLYKTTGVFRNPGFCIENYYQ